jgi:hypothetical protein
MAQSKKDTSIATCERLDRLLQSVERHRLMFLYWATANRTNPLLSQSRGGSHEHLHGDEIRGWKEMVDAIDPAGDFLWTHREVLDRYASKALERFGPREGTLPTSIDESGRRLPVEGATLPYWTLGDGGDLYLEETSAAIQNACRAIAELGQSALLDALVRDANERARAPGHERWHTPLPVEWKYLSSLDVLIARIKSTRVEVALPSHWDSKEQPGSEATKAAPQDVADLVVLCMVLRDLLRVGRDYPDALPEADREAWTNDVSTHADAILKRPGFDELKGLMRSPEMKSLEVPDRVSTLMSVALMSHPAMALESGSAAEIERAMETAMSTCQATASSLVQAHVRRLVDLIVVSCRCPSGTGVKGFSDPARSLQMCGQYWRLASALVHTQATVHVGFCPHPLLHVIENLRDRLSTCFSHLSDLDGAGEAKQACDQLVGLLTEGDVGDLAAVPEWTDGELQKVERFIARARLKVGSRVFALTGAEQFFITHAEQLIAEHDKRCRAMWKRMVARADAHGAARRLTENSPKPPPDPGTALQPAGTPERRMERIGPLLASLVAVDNGIVSLGGRMRSLTTRGNAANTHDVTVKVQEQLHTWIDPIVQHLKDAESASNGVGPHLVGLIAEPVAWEVDTRLAIRTLKERLVGLMHANGGETEESLVVGAASSLCDKGQRLQAAFEALNAQAAVRSEADAEVHTPLAQTEGANAMPEGPSVSVGSTKGRRARTVGGVPAGTTPQMFDRETQRGVGDGMSIEVVIEKAEAHVKRNNGVYPGRNRLATIVGCAPSSITKALKRSPYLRARKAEHEAKRSGCPRTVNMELSMDAFEARPESTSESKAKEHELKRLIGEQQADLARDEREGQRFRRRPEGG